MLKLATTPPACAALAREAARLDGLAHPGIVKLTALLEDARGAILVTEYLPRGDLSGCRGKPWRDTLPLLQPALDALAHLHAHGTVHGDLKSTNLVCSAEGRARLVDLEDPQLDGVGRSSPYGRSPARWRGERAVAADDAYALGALLYELIGGAPPLYPDLAAARRGAQPPPVGAGRDVPVALCALIVALLDPDPALRPGAPAVTRRLRKLFATVPSAQGPAARSAIHFPDAA